MELVQQEVQVYSSPDDFFATFDDDSRERVKEWRQDCNDVDQWLNKYDPKLRDERDGENVTGLKEQLRELKVMLGVQSRYIHLGEELFPISLQSAILIECDWIWIWIWIWFRESINTVIILAAGPCE